MIVNVLNTDYVYMRTNNVIISNNQSKDLIDIMMFTCHKRNSYSRLHAISNSMYKM